MFLGRPDHPLGGKRLREDSPDRIRIFRLQQLLANLRFLHGSDDVSKDLDLGIAVWRRQDQEDEMRVLAVGRIPVLDPRTRPAEDDDGPGHPGKPGVRDGQPALEGRTHLALPLLHGGIDVLGIVDAFLHRRQLGEFQQCLIPCRRLQVGDDGAFEEVLQDADLLASGDHVAQPGPQDHRREERSEDDRHKDRLGDQAILQGQQADDDLHLAARGVSHGDGGSIAPRQCREPDSQPRPQIPTGDTDDRDEDRQKPVEMGRKVDLQSQAGKEERNKHRIAHL